jgi:hypothetical protein
VAHVPANVGPITEDSPLPKSTLRNLGYPEESLADLPDDMVIEVFCSDCGERMA